MWNDVIREMRRFEGAVLTGVDVTGRPASFPCRPERDQDSKLLIVPLAAAPTLCEGTASMLFRKHDEHLVKPRSFLLKGYLRRCDDRWQFEPHTFVPGQGIGGLWSYVRLLRQGRRNTRRYLARRGLVRPEVSWAEIEQLLLEAQQ